MRSPRSSSRPRCARSSRWRNVHVSLYLVALAGIGLLSTMGIIVSMDTFGPVSDNAAGHRRDVGRVGEAGRILAELDAVGNTTKAITKGVAIATAVIAARPCSPRSSRPRGPGDGRLKHVTGDALFHNSLTRSTWLSRTCSSA